MLHLASYCGHESLIPDLVNRDRSILNCTDEETNTALHLASMAGNIKCVAV